MVRKAGEAFIKTWPIAGIGLAVGCVMRKKSTPQTAPETDAQ